MSDSPLHLDAYLERIRYDRSLSPSVETLCGLHHAQAMSIPFENLDLFLGRPIRLDPASLVSKLVDERRGGYCYELNGLFLMALQRLGFSVIPLAARVFSGDTLLQKSHQLMLVEIGGKSWLADVGFGSNGLIEAIPLELEREFPQRLDTFRLKADAKLGFVLQHRIGERWRNLYGFSLEEYYPADHRMMNHYSATSPASLFTQHIICTLPADDARILLYDRELKIRSLDGKTSTTRLEGEDGYRETLRRWFGVMLPAGAVLQSPFSQVRIVL